MTDAPAAASSDTDLLSIATETLREAGFEIEELPGNPSVILAENRYFVVAVAATPTIQQLLVAEGEIETVLANRLAQSEPGPKIWDSYVVLVTQERSIESDEASRALYAINYDTARVRRIAHVGVEPSPEGLREVLAPFVAPLAITDSSVSERPMALLLQSLSSRGIDRGLASRAVAAFEQGASLVDVL